MFGFVSVWLLQCLVSLGFGSLDLVSLYLVWIIGFVRFSLVLIIFCS